MVTFHVERLGRISHVLHGYGIRLGLEVVSRVSDKEAANRSSRGWPTSIPSSGAPEEAPNLGVLLDAFHLYAAGEAVEAGLRWGVSKVVWVHVADLPASATGRPAAIRDAERGLPGAHGAVDCRGLLARLARAGYDGPVTAEPFKNCQCLADLSVARAVRRVATSLRSVWPDGNL